MSVVMYGIKNCDTVKKAKKWLDSNGIEFTFHDYRKDGLSDELLSSLESTLGWKLCLTSVALLGANCQKKKKKPLIKKQP